MRRVRLSLLLAIALSSPAAVTADEGSDRIVFWPLVTDGAEYRRVAHPPQAGTMVVMAGTDVVVDARLADVRYWPITREYLSDVTGSSERAEGTFELVGPDGAVRTLATEPYLQWYPDGVGAGPAEIVRGERAAEVYADYVAAARAAARAEQLHQIVVAEHQAAVEAWLKIAAQRPATLPPPPPELEVAPPEPYRAFATEPANAAVVSLEPGDYVLRLRRPDGSVAPDGERRVTAIAPRAVGTGYVVRPADRWTQPSVSFSPREAIYTTGASDLYLQPVAVAEFGARDLGRLFRPQSIEVSDPRVTVWTPSAGAATGDFGESRLRLDAGGTTVGEVGIEHYRVVQRPGRNRGYAIEPFEPVPGSSLEPDFSAMHVPAEAEVTAVSIADGQRSGTGERTIRTVGQVSEAGVFACALLPLAAGIAVRLLGRRRPARQAPRAGDGEPGRRGRGPDLRIVGSAPDGYRKS